MEGLGEEGLGMEVWQSMEEHVVGGRSFFLFVFFYIRRRGGEQEGEGLEMLVLPVVSVSGIEFTRRETTRI